MSLRLTQDASYRVRQAHDEIGCDGRLANGAPNAIGSKVFSGHACCFDWIDCGCIDFKSSGPAKPAKPALFLSRRALEPQKPHFEPQ